jgi:hypothetical protein
MKLNPSPDLSLTSTDKAFISALQKVSSITFYVDCLDSERSHYVTVNKGIPYIIGITSDAFACVRIEDSEGYSDGTVGFDLKVVQGLLKNVGPINIKTTEGKLHMSAVKGRYKASTEFIEFDESNVTIVRNYMSAENSNSIDPDIIAALREGLKSCELTNFYSDDTILAYIRLSKGNVSVACADNFHVALYNHKVKNKLSMKFAIPSRTFSVIDKFISGNKATIDIGLGRMRVAGENFVLCLPEVQVEDELFELVPSYIESLGKTVTRITFSRSDMKALDNMFAITDEDTKLQIAVREGKAKISLTTRAGSVSDIFKVEMKGKPRVAHIDPRIFNDLFKKISDDEIPMEFYIGDKGASSCFKFSTSPSEDANLIQIGTFYDE